MTITLWTPAFIGICMACVFIGMTVVAVRALNTENKLRSQIASLYKQLTDEETKHRAIRNL